MLLHITKHKRAEEVAQRSQRRLRDVIDGLGPSMFAGLMTRQGILIEANRPALAAAGLKLEDVLGKPFEETYWWAYSREVQQQLREAIARAACGEASRYDVQVRVAESRLIDIDFSLRPLRDESGKVAFIVPSASVITERKQAENALRANEEKLQRLVESSRDAIMILEGPSWRVASGNPAIVKMFRAKNAEEFIALRSWELSPDRQPGGRASAEQAREMIATAMRDGSHVFEWTHRRIGDEDFPTRVLLTRQEQRGKVILQATVCDITERKQAEKALRTSEERFKTMFVQAPLGIAMIDSLTGHIHEANPRFVEIAGKSIEEMVSIDWMQITHPDDVQAGLVNMALLNAGKINGFRMESRYFHRDGTAVWIDMTVRPLKVEDKAHPRHLCMVQDITERKKAEAKIAHLNRVYAVQSGINTLIMRVRDRDELFREACRIAVDAGGLPMSMIAIVDRSEKKIATVASSGMDEELLTAINGLLSSSEDAPNTMVVRAMREKRSVVSNNSPSDPQALLGGKHAESGVRSVAVLPLVVSDEAVGVLALYAGETEFFHEEELKLLTDLAGNIAFAIDHIGKEERLDYLAYYDVLTGLANRSLFLERVAQHMHSAASGGHKLALFLVDLERFKSINDSLGRPAGDMLLRQVTEWLTRDLGGANLLARVGADHFAVVLPKVKQDGDVARLLEKKMTAFQDHPFRLNDAVFRIAAKVGVALFPDDGADADALFKNAEAALKRAKASGDRYLFHTQEMTATVAGKLTLENQLRLAVDKGEFVLHYQPKVNLASGKVTSAEALIRWNDPHTGLVAPGRFIPILEETGLIHEVGRWALRQAIEDYLRWRAAGLPAVRIAVNVSPLQLHHRGFIAEIEQVIGIDVQAVAGLELEITESLIMADVKRSIDTLHAIRAMNVTVAIDDFGTGFSSLSYLSKLPVDTLKIDRSFVIDMTAGPNGLALMSTMINLAHSLKLKVVAEGVETEEQSRLLRLLNCDEMQGYLFCKPVPGEIFETKYLVPAG